MTEEEILSLIPEVLEKMPFYGEFALPEYVDFDETITGPLLPEEKTNRYNEWMYAIDTVLIYLVSNGFAINRHDIKQKKKSIFQMAGNEENMLFRQLTDNGRILKECKTIDAYNKKMEAISIELEQEKTNKKSDQERNRYIFWITICIAISTAMQGVWNFLETVRNYYNKGAWPIIYIIVPLLSVFFLLYVSHIVLRELLKGMKRKKR